MSDGERLVLLCVLWPLLWLQAKHVRRTVPQMPEPPGHRAGTAGQGSLMRLLVAGDSAFTTPFSGASWRQMDWTRQV